MAKKRVIRENKAADTTEKQLEEKMAEMNKKINKMKEERIVEINKIRERMGANKIKAITKEDE